MNTIQQQWEAYSRQVVPEAASEIQKRDMRRAFYAGAAGLMQIQMTATAMGVSEDAGIGIVDGVITEITEFAQRVLRGSE